MQKIRAKFMVVIVIMLVVTTFAGFLPIVTEAATIPKLIMVAQPAREYKPGQRVSFTVTSPNYSGRVQYRVILWNGTTKKTSELWNTPKTGYYYTGWMPAGNYKFTIHWPVTGMEPGAYSLTVLVRRVGSKVPYDSYVKTNAFWVRNSNFPAINGTSAVQNNYGKTMQKQGDWIYYYDLSENGLCMIKYDGTGKKKLSGGQINCLTISGGWVYFTITEDIGLTKIRRVRLDGTGNTVIVSNRSTGRNITNIGVANNRLYYLYGEQITSSNLDGTDVKYIHIGDSPRTMMVYNNQIYFTTYYEVYIKRINLDGSGMTRLTKGGSYHFVVDNNWLYYVDSKDGNKLYKTKIDGETYLLPYGPDVYNNELGLKDQEIIKVTDFAMEQPIIKDGWIYYYNSNDNYCVYRVKLDGSENKKLTNNPGSIDDIIGDWVFYSHVNANYRVHTDGTSQQKMYN